MMLVKTRKGMMMGKRDDFLSAVQTLLVMNSVRLATSGDRSPPAIANFSYTNALGILDDAMYAADRIPDSITVMEAVDDFCDRFIQNHMVPLSAAKPDAAVSIGMLRAKGKPGTSALAAAHAATMQGANLFFFNPDDVNLADRSINAWTYRDGAWQRVLTGFPDVIENDEQSREAAVWDPLTRQIPITTHRLGGKVKVMKRLSDARFYERLRIPTVTVRAFDDLKQALLHHESVVTKPDRGSQGKGVSFISREGADYRANIEGCVSRLDEDGLQAFYREKLEQKTHIVQKYIESTTLTGLPFDIRLHVRRGSNAEWQTVKIYSRIGAGRTITSNLSDGGSIATARPFLLGQFGVKGQAIWTELLRLAREMPVRFQQLYKTQLDALGIDLGIDRDGKPWLFEINSYPGARYFEMEDALPRVGYAIYLAQQYRLSTASPPVQG